MIANYKKNAETFYQLFCLRYCAARLTSYCVKLTDYGLYFMRNLPVSINRFSCQGSERINCDFNRYYHNHTTRHGTLNNLDPLLAIMRYRYFKLYAALVLENPCVTTYQINAKKNFLWMLRRHRWATIVAQQVKLWLVQRRLANLEKQKGKNKENLLLAVSDPTLPPAVKIVRDKIFPDLTKFIVLGRVKSITPTKMRCLEKATGDACVETEDKKGPPCVTQDRVKALLKFHGGNLSKSLPGKVKGRSERPYVVLYDVPPGNKPVPIEVKDAYVRNFLIVPFSYLVDCIEANAYLSPESYVQPLPQLKNLSKRLKLSKELFGKRTEVHRMKKRRAQRRRIKKPKPRILKPKLIRNAAIYYAVRRRSHIMRTQKLTFRQCRLGPFLKEWGKMPKDDPLKISAHQAYNQYRTDFIREHGPIRRNVISWFS